MNMYRKIYLKGMAIHYGTRWLLFSIGFFGTLILIAFVTKHLAWI